MEKRVTIKDVANKAGVSISTVSFILNDTPGQTITEDTRIRVLDAVKDLKYRPNIVAQNMRTKKTRSIGVVSEYNVTYIYYLEMLNGLQSAAEEKGYSITVCGRNKADLRKSGFIEYFNEGRIDGVVFISSSHSENQIAEKEYISLLKEHHIPYVVLYGYTKEKSTDYVNIDFIQNGYIAALYLNGKGYKRIKYIAPLNENLYLPKTEIDRISGVEKALGEMGLKLLSSDIIRLPRCFKDVNYDEILGSFREISKNYDAVICCWSSFALQTLNALVDIGCKVPEDLGIISLDSIPFIDFVYTPLTTVELPFYKVGKIGGDILIEKINGVSRTRSIYCECKIVERKSI